MNLRIAMSKFLRRTCLTLNQQHLAELLHTNSTATAVDRSRCLYKRRDLPCNSDSMTTTTMTMTSLLMTSPHRFHSKFTAGQHHPSARLGTATPLCHEKAYELVLTLNDAERSNLKAALTKYDTMKLKEGFEGKSACSDSACVLCLQKFFRFCLNVVCGSLSFLLHCLFL